MRDLIVVIVLLSMGIVGCNVDNNEDSQVGDKPYMPFEGNWQRTFQLGVDSLQYVYYNIYSDSIEYIMEGPLPLNYTMEVDTFVNDDNRIITRLKDVYYVLFIKNLNADSLSLFKQQMDTREEALTRVFPADTVSGHFSSWYTYYKKE